MLPLLLVLSFSLSEDVAPQSPAGSNALAKSYTALHDCSVSSIALISHPPQLPQGTDFFFLLHFFSVSFIKYSSTAQMH